MSIRIDGTNTTANPGITGGDADTGLQFGTDEIQFVTGGTNRATVESNGNFTIENGNLVLASGSGIDFSATADGSGTVNSELLDDYEEGVWTPVLLRRVNNSGDPIEATGVSYNTLFNGGWYIKTGKCVNFGATLRITNKGNFANADTLYIGGFPFAAAPLATPYGAQRSGTATAHASNISGASGQTLHMSAPNQGTDYLQLAWMNWDTGVNAPVYGSDFTSSMYIIAFGGNYITA